MRMEGRSLKPKWQPGPYAPARGPGGHPAPAFARWIATFGWRLSKTEKQYCRCPFASQIAANLSVAAKKGTSLAVETAPVMRLRYGLRYAQDWAGAPASSIRPACPRPWLCPDPKSTRLNSSHLGHSYALLLV